MTDAPVPRSSGTDRALGLIQRLERVRLSLREDKWMNGAEVITDAIAEISRFNALAQSLNQEAGGHPQFDNPRDPFASPDRLAERHADACFDHGHADGASWSVVYQSMLSLIDDIRGVAQCSPDPDLMKLEMARRKAQEQADFWKRWLADDRSPDRSHIEMAFSQLQHIADFIAKPTETVGGVGGLAIPSTSREMFKCNCPHEVRAGCSEPKCPHYTPPHSSTTRGTGA